MRLLFLCWLAILTTADSTVSGEGQVAGGGGGGVTYDKRSLIINGKRKILFSGSIHYPRSTPEMWPSLISKAKQGGLDVIQTYVFWNLHEHIQGQYDFTGRGDLVRFIKEIQKQGLYACLRIGPFIEAEWTYGGFPFWLHNVPDIVFRSDNEPFKFYMQNFTSKIVNMMKAERLYASQGGPIILSQIENEYKSVEAAYGAKGDSYVRWAAAMAVSLNTGVPWVMCKQDDAPDPMINTCNGLQCGLTFPGPNSLNKPSLWTENWTARYQVFGSESKPRREEDIAFHVVLFILLKGGSFVNYYMYQGGTNFGRTASAFVLTSYYDQAPLDEYGFITPVWWHLKSLHAAIKLCMEPLLYGTHSTVPLSSDQMQYAHVFHSGSGKCAAFLVNNDTRKSVNVNFQNLPYYLKQSSISILPDCKNLAFNTAEVTTQYSTRSTQAGAKLESSQLWQKYHETISDFSKTTRTAYTLLEHMSTTQDSSDYLWYTTRVPGDPSNARSMLNVTSYGHAVHVFVNGKLVGSMHGTHDIPGFTMAVEVTLNEGMNSISLLSVVVGLPNAGAYLERKRLGICKVQLQSRDLKINRWGYQVGLEGEMLQIYTDKGSRKVQWTDLICESQPLTWYKTFFNAPKGNGTAALNLQSMGKGAAWVNGHSLGRYWVSFLTSKGNPSQTLYHIPPSFLKSTGNLLVLLEEETRVSPLEISIDTILQPLSFSQE